MSQKKKVYYIEELVPLFPVIGNVEYADVGFIIEALKNRPVSIRNILNEYEGFYPFGTDGCGNIFYLQIDTDGNTTYLFYDHEEDEMFEVIRDIA